MSNKITLAVGAEVTLSLHGFGFYVVKSDGPVIVELREIDGSQDEAGVLEAGQGLQGSSRFEAVRIINMHSATQTIEFYVGPRTFVDNRNVGVVEVSGTVSVDPVPDFVHPAFERYSGGTPAAGEYMHTQLFNPVGSGVDLYVQEVAYSSISDAVVFVQRHSTVLSATAYGGVPIRDSADISKGETRREKNSTLLGGSEWIRVSHGLAKTSKEFGLVQPLRLKEGEGLMMKNSVVGAEFYSSYKWEERQSA